VAFHVAGHAVGPVLVRRAHGQHPRHALGVLAQQRVVAAGADGLPQHPLRRVHRGVVEPVIGGHAGAAVPDQAGFLQLGQVGGHARLRQLGDGGQFRDGQLLAFQQRQQAHAGGIGEHLEACGPAFQIHIYLSIAIQR